MKNLIEVSERIKSAIKNNERIVLYADSDLDGVTSALILEEAIGVLGGECLVYISNREKWGYGISRDAVLYMKENAPALLISLDCGISNFDGADAAKEVGFDFVIVDHHKPLEKLPDASLILDPMQEDDTYHFKKLANVGVVYRLTEELLKEEFLDKKEKFLQLAAIATIADMVPKIKDNKEILDEGLKILEEPTIPSLKHLKEKISDNFLEKTVSYLNVTRSEGDVNNAYLFFKEEGEEEIKGLFEKIEEDHEERKMMLQKEEKRILEKIIDNDEEIVFEEGFFPSYLAGSLASRIIRAKKKTVFLYVKEGDLARGSVRVIAGQDAVEAMSYCKECLEAFGGHPEAAGFIVKVEKIDDYKTCLLKYFKEKYEDNNNLH